MMVPIRCFSCGKVVGNLYEEFMKKSKSGANPEKVLDELGVTRYCCRRMLLTQVDLIDEMMKYKI